jgi:MFS family permease
VCPWAPPSTIAFYQRIAPAVLTQKLSASSRSPARHRNLSAFYFYSYVAMQIPWLIADRWGPRKLLTAGAALTAVGTLVFALAPTAYVANAGRLAIGAAAGVAFVAMLKLASHWMPSRQFALASGVALFVGVVGATMAGAPLRLLVDALGWRNVMAACAAATALVAVAIWLVARDDPAERGYDSYFPHGAGGAARGSVGGDLKAVLAYRNTWLLFVIPGAFSGIVLMFAGLWGVPFLATHYGFSTAEAASLAPAAHLLERRASRTGRSRNAWAAASSRSIAGLWRPWRCGPRSSGCRAGAAPFSWRCSSPSASPRAPSSSTSPTPRKACPRGWRAPSRASPTWA